MGNRGQVFDSLGAARRFMAGFVDPRVVIRRNGGYEIVSAKVAKLAGLAVLASNTGPAVADRRRQS